MATLQSSPLDGRRIVVTRSLEQAPPLIQRLRELGARVIHVPTIAIEPIAPDSPEALRLAELHSFDWVLFTSVNGVKAVAHSLGCPDGPLPVSPKTRVGAIGPGTARELSRLGHEPDLVPPAFVAESFLEALLETGLAGKKVLLARARKARDVLPEGLREAGAVIEVLPVYDTVQARAGAEALPAELSEGSVDLVTFTSPSTVEAFHALLGSGTHSSMDAAVIGPVTATRARELGYRVTVEAGVHTIEGLVDAVVKHYEEL